MMGKCVSHGSMLYGRVMYWIARVHPDTKVGHAAGVNRMPQMLCTAGGRRIEEAGSSGKTTASAGAI
jgi:hypothetical protein